VSARIIISDEASTGKLIREFALELLEPTLTVRELIELRVRDEVERFNRSPGVELFHGLVQPTDAEATLNGYRLRNNKTIDPEAQIAKALQAFERNGFLLLAGDRQLESLDERVTLGPGTRVAFVKLVQLVGG